ncbi:hypothetical protein K438DRAFT_1789119 [Mycena galopus ATCC 62051]|nr:hypothetical protein K438DRAFT_1789119 [Mycena galopus ATCC 62051]
MSQATNMRADEVIMDTRGGGQDPRYYCLPPFHGDAEREIKRFYLVSQGRVVGVFDDWLMAKASVSGFPDNSHRAYKTMHECIIAWQGLCRLGLHPHPVDPEFEHTARAPLVRAVRTPPPSTTTAASGAKQVETPRRAGAGALRNTPLGGYRNPAPPHAPTPSPVPPVRKAPPPSPKTPVCQAAAGEGEFLNFAIRGAGIVSSSVSRTEHRYRELQSQGEELELLVTRSLQEASFFAVDDGDEV